MSLFKKIILPLLLTTFTSCSFAGIQIGATRVIYEEQKQDAVLKISNPDKMSNYLIQSWIGAFTETEPAVNEVQKKPAEKFKSPFVVTPPLFSISAGEENIIRIIHNGKALPADHESIFWLNIKSIPETEKKDTNMVIFSVKSSLKLIYRPEALSGEKATNAYRNITFKKDGNQLIAENPTPYYLTLSSLKADDHELTIKDKVMLSPHSSQRYDLGKYSNTKTVSWETLGDLGQITDAMSAKL